MACIQPVASAAISLALKVPYEQIHACPKRCILFRKVQAEVKYCAKCASSSFLEVDSGDGQKRQILIPVKILWYHQEDPTTFHDREIHETDDMAQKGNLIQS